MLSSQVTEPVADLRMEVVESCQQHEYYDYRGTIYEKEFEMAVCSKTNFGYYIFFCCFNNSIASVFIDCNRY
jgi:hypothetical protein